ncbi:MAG: GNAT family N-acetyltransferase [Pikeienuella sp.]
MIPPVSETARVHPCPSDAVDPAEITVSRDTDQAIWRAASRDARSLGKRRQTGGRCAPREVEVMSTLSRPFRGRGYATEIARLWVAHAFGELKLRCLVTAPQRDNRASVAVLMRLGARSFDDRRDPDTLICVLANESLTQPERLA